MPAKAAKRTYPGQEYCPVARTLEVVGDRWTILIIRNIFDHKRKFSELLDSLPGISPNLLADRLKRLENRDILTRRFYTSHPPRAEYWFTDKGKAFGKVLSAMRDWGEAWQPEAQQTDKPTNRQT